MDRRIRTVQADLDAGWPATGPMDLVWASNSLHHMADPDRVLAGVFAALRPAGYWPWPRWTPSRVSCPRTSVPDSKNAAMPPWRRAGSPAPAARLGLGSRLRKAGFLCEAERTFAIDLAPPLPAAAGRYAQLSLQRIRSGLDGQISAADLATLDVLLDGDGPGSILRRDDLTVRTTRTVWVARRP